MTTRGAAVEGLTVRDRAVYVEAADALVLADTHLGRDASSNVQLRLGEDDDIVDRVAALLDRFEPATFVVAGDLLHSFDSVPAGVRESLRAPRSAARTAGARMVVTPGNHDSMLTTLWDGPAPAEHRLDDGTVVLHGHEAPEADASLYIVGHDHPTIEIEGQRRPCYLHGPTAAGPGEAIVLMVPSFTRLAAGVAVNEMRTGAFQSPLVTEADLLRPLVRDEPADETLAFPPLGRFRELL